MRQHIKNFTADETGTVAIEYGFILVLITVGIIASVISMGDSVQTYLNNALAGISR